MTRCTQACAEMVLTKEPGDLGGHENTHPCKNPQKPAYSTEQAAGAHTGQMEPGALEPSCLHQMPYCPWHMINVQQKFVE